MKILIVDDEKISRKVLLKQFEGIGDCTAVDDGRAGLELITRAIQEKVPFDLVTMDVSMPKISGQQLLKMVRQKEKALDIPKADRTKIIMVTSRMNLSTIKDCIRLGCDGYLSKPVQKYQLMISLAKSGVSGLPEIEEFKKEKYAAIVADIIKRFYAGQIQMPVMPEVVSEIRQVITKKDPSIQELAQIAAKDILITSKLISISNSTLYRGFEKVTDLNAAVVRMGIKAASGLISSLLVLDMFKSDNEILNTQVKKLWGHSFACGCFARRIGQELKIEDTETLFLMGMIHDIGKMLLIRAICDINPEERFKEDMQVAIHEIHTTFGAALLKRMRFAKSFVQVAEFHHWNDFSQSDERELMIISLADELADKTGFAYFNPEMDPDAAADPDTLSLSSNNAIYYLGLELTTLYDIAEEMRFKIEECQSVM